MFDEIFFLIYLFPSFSNNNKIARLGSKALQKLEPEERAQLLRNVAQSLKHNLNELIIANNVDLEKAKDGSKLIN